VMLTISNIAVHMQLISLPALIVGDAAHAILVAGGVICTQLYNPFREKPALLLLIGLIFIGFGLILSGFTDGINKIRATPAWVHICMGISLVFYAASVYLIDLKRKEHYFSWISAAGTNTLTCYLLPYCWYAIYQTLGLQWPTLFNVGVGGIFRSFLIAFMIVQIAGWMGKRGIRIKV
jgi:heparan-alpha-glucosaminide N-acetyltransferase